MESIREGWLIKSPPEKRSQGRWKLFKAKWRRRYFVLYAPPAADIIPGMCAAILDYYSSKNLRHKNGTIDLTHCEEVLSQLDATFYQNIFGLRTKHKNKDRTYYLVADNEADMNEWVNSLCFVLGMKENGQFSGQDSVPSSPTFPAGTLPQSLKPTLPSPSATRFNSTPSLPPPRSDTLPFPHRGGARKITNHTRVHSLPGINETANSEMENWQTGRPSSSDAASPIIRPVVGHRDNHLTLKFVPPPPPPTSTLQRRSCVLSAIPDHPQVFEEAASIVRNIGLSENSTTDYDRPKQSYYHQSFADESNNNFFPRSPFLINGLYNVPTKNYCNGNTEQDCLYKIPPSRSVGFSDCDDFRYDVPASARACYDVPAKCTEPHSLCGEHYDVPPSSAPAYINVSLEESRNSEKPSDDKDSSHLLSVLQNLLNELPSLNSVEDRILQAPVYCNVSPKQSSVDGKITSQDLLSLSPPVPGANKMTSQTYINANVGNCEVQTSSDPSTDDGPASVNHKTTKGLGKANLHPSYGAVPTVHDPICFTHRSKSFKRTQSSMQDERVRLPIKRNSEADDSSSISDDEDDGNNSSQECPTESLTQTRPSIYDIVPLPARKDLLGTPPAPNSSEIIKYLDLDLEESSTTDKFRAGGKTFEVFGNGTGIHYKEIDWCKTKALTETRREVENNRRTSERLLSD